VGCEDDVAKIFPYIRILICIAYEQPSYCPFRETIKSTGKNEFKGVFIAGRPRLAYYSTATGGVRDCVIVTCVCTDVPYDLIYSSRSTLAEWERQGKIIYEKDVSVDSVEECQTK